MRDVFLFSVAWAIVIAISLVVVLLAPVAAVGKVVDSVRRQI